MVLVDNRNNTDPFINLAIEDYLVRIGNGAHTDFLFLYINEPSVVVGKNQCLYKEVNFDFLRNDKIKICRRISGGGTVFHDLGNLNFSFVTTFSEDKVNNYKHFNQPIVEALKQIGINAYMDTRNNILCNGKKISGNAQFTNRKSIISHGTLLVNADLETLGPCLKANEFAVETKAVSSVRSPVINISQLSDKISTAPELKEYLVETLMVNDVFRFTSEQWNEMENLAEEKFKSFEWVYGRSPKTIIRKKHMDIELTEALISAIESRDYSLQFLVGVRYSFQNIKKALRDTPNASEILQLVF